MLVVIYAHALNYLDGERFAHPIVQLFSTFEMPVFFVASGALLAMSGRMRDVWTTMTRKGRALLVPYVGATLVSWGCFVGGSLPDELLNGGFWFLRILFFVFVLHAATVGKGTARRGVLFVRLALASALAWTLATAVPCRTFRQLGYFFFWFETAFWLVRLGGEGLKTRLSAISPRQLLGCCSFLFFVLLPVFFSVWRRFAIPPMAFCGVFFVFALSAALLGSSWTRSRTCVAFVGRHSLAFYVLHVLIGQATIRFWPQLQPQDATSLYYFVALPLLALLPALAWTLIAAIMTLPCVRRRARRRDGVLQLPL